MEAHKLTSLVSLNDFMKYSATPNAIENSVVESLNEASVEHRRDIEELKKYAK